MTKIKSEIMDLSKTRIGGFDEMALAEDILAVLDTVEASRSTFETHASRRGISVNQLLAASIAGMIAEKFDQGQWPFLNDKEDMEGFQTSNVQTFSVTAAQEVAVVPMPEVVRWHGKLAAAVLHVNSRLHWDGLGLVFKRDRQKLRSPSMGILDD